MDGPTWAARLAAKIKEQIERAETRSEDDSDDDAEATGSITEFLADLEGPRGDDGRGYASLSLAAGDPVPTLRALLRLIDPD